MYVTDCPSVTLSMDSINWAREVLFSQSDVTEIGLKTTKRNPKTIPCPFTIDLSRNKPTDPHFKSRGNPLPEGPIESCESASLAGRQKALV